MPKETPDFIKRMEDRSDEEEAARRLLEKDASMPRTMQSLGDGVISTLRTIVEESGGEPKPREVEGFPDRELMNLQVAVHHFRQRVGHWKAEAIEVAASAAIEAYGRGLRLTESPIERILLPWLIVQDYWPMRADPASLFMRDTDRVPPPSDLFIAPQFEFGGYRMDFALVARKHRRIQIVAVECDGAEFHEPVKDRERDAYFAAFRIPTIRAAGREIIDTPQRVAHRVAHILADWAGSL